MMLKTIGLVLLLLLASLLSACNLPWKAPPQADTDLPNPTAGTNSRFVPLTGEGTQTGGEPPPLATDTSWISSDPTLQSIQATATAIHALILGIPPATPAAVPNQTEEPSAAALSPAIRITDQNIQNGKVVIDHVTSSGPGWVAIYPLNDGKPGQAIGYAPVQNGDNQGVIIQVDPVKTTDTLVGVLHTDAGKPGVFEFPGPDGPVVDGVQVVAAQFKNTAGVGNMGNLGTPVPFAAGQSPTPAITVQDQEIHQGVVIIPKVISAGNDWLVIHPSDSSGAMDSFIGFAPLQQGENDNVRVSIDTGRTTRTMFAMLHVNASKATAPNIPGVDVPISVNGQIVAPTFKVIGPLGGTVELSTAKTKTGAAYLVDSFGMSLYTNMNDQPGKICTGECLGTFRPLLANGDLSAGQGVSMDKVGFNDLPDGTRQITYGGVRLYYNAQDQKPGDNKGQYINGPWALIPP